MPFIGGRYYANALAGHAIEAARAAEAALHALKKKPVRSANTVPSGAADLGTDSEDPDDDPGSDTGSDTGFGEMSQSGNAPIHRVEIEAAELVPSHTGRAQRGFVARVHRDPAPAGDAANGSVTSPTPPGQLPSRGYAPKPETHVFAGHSDLLDFLKSELSGRHRTE